MFRRNVTALIPSEVSSCSSAEDLAVWLNNLRQAVAIRSCMEWQVSTEDLPHGSAANGRCDDFGGACEKKSQQIPTAATPPGAFDSSNSRNNHVILHDYMYMCVGVCDM